MDPARMTDIAGLTVGHWTDAAARTGCTVVLCPAGAVAAADVRGGAPGTRETDLLQSGRLVEQIHAVALTGGSAWGLACADGVMRWLAERGHGFDARVARVPIVPAAVLFDLGVGDPAAYPDSAAGYAACQSAAGAIAEGALGAGAGAMIGKLGGMERASRGGVGHAALRLPDGTTVAALVAVNAFGDVVDPRSGAIVAGLKTPGGGFANTVDTILQTEAAAIFGGANTTIGVIATDAALDKAMCQRVAAMAQAGMAQAIRPVHSPFDGDTLFALALPHPGAPPPNLIQIGVAAAQVTAAAIVRAAHLGALAEEHANG